MKTILIALLAVLYIPVMASAQIGAAAGTAKDWIKLTEDGDYKELSTPLVGVSYDVAMTDSRGYTLSYRGSDGDIRIHEYSFGMYARKKDKITIFADASGETWDDGATGSTEFLWGGRTGVRATIVGGGTSELSVAYKGGEEGKRHVTVFFGLRIAAS